MKKTHEVFFKVKKPWSIFKDEILQKYLRPYIQKILFTNKPLYYIDGYAGKGMFEDGNLGSPIIALNAIEDALKVTKVKFPRIKTYFIEKFFSKDLIANLEGRQNINIISGCFQNCVDDILRKVGNDNVFIYIDPFGVKDLDMKWFNELIESDFYSIEFLLNFNSNGFFRLACSAMNVRYLEGEPDDLYDYEEIKYFPEDEKVSMLDRIAGGSFWKQIVLDYKDHRITGKEAEKRISNEFCFTLRRYFEYVLEMPISDSLTNTPKYRMIHATKKMSGYYLMIDTMFNQTKRMRASHLKGQLTFLNETFDLVPFDLNEEKQYLLSKIDNNTKISITEVFVNYYKERGLRCCPSDLRKFVKDFESNRIIVVERVPESLISGKPTIFLTESGKQTVKLSRK